MWILVFQSLLFYPIGIENAQYLGMKDNNTMINLENNW